MKRNVSSQIVGAQMVDVSTGGAFAGAVTVYVTGDGGTQAIGSVGSGVCTAEGNGFFSYAPAQAETNYDHVAFTFIGTGAIPATVQIYTTFPQTGDNFARLGAPAGASFAADMAAVKTQTAAIEVDTQDIQSRLPVSLVSGRIDASVGAMAANTLTASAFATDAVTEIQTGLSTLDAAGVRSAVGLASANLDAQIGSLATASALSTVDTAVDAIRFTTDKLDDTLELDGSDYRFTAAALAEAPSGGGGLTVQDIVDGVWDENIADHLTSGSMGAALNAAGSAGDPWSTVLPGAYGAGTAGYIVGTNLDEPVSGVGGLDEAGVRSAIGLASANLDTQLDALPTAAENTTAVWSAGNRTLTALDEDTTAIDLDVSVRSALGLASANLDTQLGALPTAAEVADEVQTRTISAVTTVNGLASNVITAASMATDAVTEIQSGLATAAALVTVDTAVDAIKARTDNLPDDPADASDIAAGFAGVPTVDDFWDEEVDGTITARQSMRLANATLGGKASGLETTTAVYRDLADTKDRVIGSVDANGNRTAVTLDLT